MNESNRSAQGKKGLAPQWYLDPEIFRFELDRIFAQAWIPVGYCHQIERPGEFLRAQIHGIPAILVRDEQNRMRAFHNVCQHRGTQLCTSEKGVVRSNFVCPYHGWRYDLQGRLVSAPTMNEVEQFFPEHHGLPELGIRSWNGLLFGHGDAGRTPEPAGWPLSRLDPVADRYQLGDYRLVETISYEIAANWKLIFQNFNECYHCPSVHPQLTPLSDFRDSENDFESGPLLGGPMKIRESAETLSLDGSCCGRPNRSLPESERKLARYYTLFPNLFLSLFPDYVMIHRLTPLSLDRTLVVCDFLFHPETVGDREFDPGKAARFWDLTNRQDWEMCERVQTGLATPGFRPSPYSNLESLLAAFDGHYVAEMIRLGFPMQDEGSSRSE